jgi:hypothetical protein
MRKAPELIDVDSTRLEEVLRRAEQSLDEKDAALIRAVFESYAYVTDLVEDKNTSIRRLRQLLFGIRTEKTQAVVGETSGAGPQPGAGIKESHAADGENSQEESNESNESAPSPGQGRNGADA